MKRLLTFLLIAALLFSTGCSAGSSLFSNYRAIEELKLVHTLGFDLYENGIELSICGGEKDGQGITQLSATGRNISQCLATLQNYSGKEELYYAHTRYVLVGEEYAKQGLGDVMQYLESSNQLRSDLPLFIVKNGTAKELVTKVGGEKSSINDALEAVMRECSKQGSAFPFTCGDLGSFSAEYGSALACCLDITKAKDVNPKAEDEELTPAAAGYAVINNGNLAGYLSENAARAVNFLINELGTEPFTMISDGQPVSLRVTKADTHLRPRFSDSGLIELTVQLDLNAVLEESQQKAQVDTERIAMTMEASIQQWLEEIIMAMRNTNSDFLGFGARIAIDEPKEFFRSPLQWTEQLKTLPILAEVHCTVSRGENEPRR